MTPDGGLDPGLFALIMAVVLGGAGYLWAWWSHRRYIRKYGRGRPER